MLLNYNSVRIVLDSYILSTAIHNYTLVTLHRLSISTNPNEQFRNKIITYISFEIAVEIQVQPFIEFLWEINSMKKQIRLN